MIYKNLRKYLNSYISTRLVFVLDLIMSFGASLLTLYLVNNITVRNLFELKPLGIWLASSFLFSFIFIWAFRTYRIIIRHMTIKELSRFVLVAVSKVLMMGFVFALLDSTSKVLNLMMISDFFFTFAACC